MKRFRTLFLMAAFSWVFVIATQAVAKDEDFSLSKLSIAGEVLELIPADLDADSLSDIVILHRKGLPPNQTRWVSVFWQAKDGTFSTAPDQSWEIDTLATVADVGNVTRDPQLEICYLTSGSVRYYQLEDHQFMTTSKNLFACSTLTVFPSNYQIPVIDFVRNWDGHPGDEVAVFGFDGLDLYQSDSSGHYASGTAMHIDLQTRLAAASLGGEHGRIAGVETSFTFPDITIADYNGDGRNDIIAIIDDQLQVYPQMPEGGFSREPASKTTLDVLTQTEKREKNTEVNTVVADLNGDSYADAVITKMTSKGLSSMRSVINIFWGRPSGYPDTPDQVIVSEGSASAQVSIRDVNGDGKMDLIMPSLRLSITAIIRILITRNVPVTFNIFLYHEGRRYSDRPDFEKEVKFKIDFSGESDTQAMSLDGDYNGDGVNDFVLATAKDRLSIYLGDENNSEKLFAKKAASKVRVDAFGDLITKDLNNDGFSDMILSYPNTKDRRGQVEVLINRRTIR